MLKIVLISLISLFLSVVIKQKSSEFSMMINITAGLLIVMFCFEYLSEMISYLTDLSSSVNIDNSIIKIAFKIICISFLTEFSSSLAIDFGNTAIASKIVFGGKLIICILTLPIVKELVALLFSFY